MASSDVLPLDTASSASLGCCYGVSLTMTTNASLAQGYAVLILRSGGCSCDPINASLKNELFLLESHIISSPFLLLLLFFKIPLPNGDRSVSLFSGEQ